VRLAQSQSVITTVEEKTMDKKYLAMGLASLVGCATPVVQHSRVVEEQKEEAFQRMYESPNGERFIEAGKCIYVRKPAPSMYKLATQEPEQ
jgi:predicted ATP-dependent serine protease